MLEPALCRIQLFVEPLFPVDLQPRLYLRKLCPDGCEASLRRPERACGGLHRCLNPLGMVIDFLFGCKKIISIEVYAILNGIKLKFFEALPERFDRQTYLKIAFELGIKEKAAEKYTGQFKPKLLDHEHNQYTKL